MPGTSGTTKLTTKPPAYVLNAGKDGLPIADGKRPSWLVKEDELIIDARPKISRSFHSQELGGFGWRKGKELHLDNFFGGGREQFVVFQMLGIIIPIDFHIVQRV